MELLIYESKAGRFSYNPIKSVIYEEFYETSSQATSDEMLVYWTKLEVAFRLYRPKYNLTDARNFRYLIDPAMQRFIDNGVATTALDILERKALIIATDAWAQFAIEQTLQENHAAQIEIRYFTTVEEAEKFLFG